MKKYIGYIFLIILICLWLAYLWLGKEKAYTANLFYMDTYISVEVYASNPSKANDALKVVETLYKDFDSLTNRYDKNSQVYFIKNNQKDDMYLTIDNRLYTMLEYGKTMYLDTNGLLNINIGNAVDLWKSYRDAGTGVPSDEELTSIGSTSIDDIVLKDGKILNNHPNIDLGSITKGYVTELAGQYLESINIKKYMINAGGTVKVGKGYKKDYYNVGIESPEKDGTIFDVVKINNKSVSTSGSYERFYEYDGQLYHHIIDPNTYLTPNYMKSVTVICNDAALADSLSTALFLMTPEEGVDFIKKYDDVEAIWYVDDSTIIKSEGFGKYESK